MCSSDRSNCQINRTARSRLRVASSRSPASQAGLWARRRSAPLSGTPSRAMARPRPAGAPRITGSAPRTAAPTRALRATGAPVFRPSSQATISPRPSSASAFATIFRRPRILSRARRCSGMTAPPSSSAPGKAITTTWSRAAGHGTGMRRTPSAPNPRAVCAGPSAMSRRRWNSMTAPGCRCCFSTEPRSTGARAFLPPISSRRSRERRARATSADARRSTLPLSISSKCSRPPVRRRSCPSRLRRSS